MTLTSRFDNYKSQLTAILTDLSQSSNSVSNEIEKLRPIITEVSIDGFENRSLAEKKFTIMQLAALQILENDLFKRTVAKREEVRSNYETFVEIFKELSLQVQEVVPDLDLVAYFLKDNTSLENLETVRNSIGNSRFNAFLKDVALADGKIHLVDYFKNGAIKQALKNNEAAREIFKIAVTLDPDLALNDFDQYGFPTEGEENQAFIRDLMGIMRRNREAVNKIFDNYEKFGLDPEIKENQKYIKELILDNLDSSAIPPNFIKFGINDRSFVEKIIFQIVHSNHSSPISLSNFGLKPDVEGDRVLAQSVIDVLVIKFYAYKMIGEYQNYAAFVDRDFTKEKIAFWMRNPSNHQNLIEHPFVITSIGDQEFTLQLLKEFFRYSRNASSIIRNIQFFSLDFTLDENKKFIREMIRLSPGKDYMASLVIHFKNLGLDFDSEEDQKLTREFIKHAIDLPGRELADNFDCFKLKMEKQENQVFVYQVAKALAERDAISVINNLEKFSLVLDPAEHQKFMKELVILAAAQNGQETLSKWTKFGIDDEGGENQRFLKEVVKKAVAQDVRAVLSVSMLPLKFNADEKEAFIYELVQIAASYHGTQVDAVLPNFVIENPAKLQKIARIAILAETPSKILGYSSFENSRFASEVMKISKNPSYEMAKEWIAPPSLAWFDKIYQTSKPENKSHLETWILPLCARSLAGSMIFSPQNESCLLEIAKLRNPSIRQQLTQIFEASPVETPSKFSQVLISQIALSFLAKKEPEIYKKILALVEKQKRSFFNDDKVLIQFIDIALKLKALPMMARKGAVLKALLEITDKKDKKKMIESLGIVLQAQPHLIKNLCEEADVHQNTDFLTGFGNQLGSLFTEIFPLNNIENLGLKYIKTFGSCRNILAIFTYATVLKTLPSNQLSMVSPLLNTYVTNVLEDTFKSERYSTDHHLHLKTVFESKDGIEERWKTTIKYEVDFNPKVEALDAEYFKTFLNNKILRDKHLPPDQFPGLVKVLNNPTSLDEVLQSLKRDNSSSSLDEEVRKRKIEIACLQLLTAVDKVSSLKELKGLLLDTEEFKNDIIGAINLSMGEKSGLQKYTVEITDDPYDMLLIGTEVNGSCQRVAGDASPVLNKGVLAYALNGYYQAAVVKDASGVIVGRMMHRLCYDSKNNVPVLYIEEPYVNIPAYTQLLDSINSQRAKELGIEVFSKQTLDRPIQVLSSVSPYGDYVDAIGGFNEAPYTIRS